MSDFEFSSSLKSHLRANRQTVQEHPAPEALVACRAGTLDPEDEQAIRDHLVACESCSSLYLGLATLETGESEIRAISEHELERAWQRQRSRLFTGPARPGIAPIHRMGWVAAACLSLVVAGLGFEIRELGRENDRFYDDLPRVIAAERSTRTQTRETPTLVVQADQPGIVLLLLDDDLTFDSFRVEFFSTSERPILTRQGLLASEDLLLLGIPPDLLPVGAIRVVVSGLREGRYKTVEEYDMWVSRP